MAVLGELFLVVVITVVLQDQNHLTYCAYPVDHEALVLCVVQDSAGVDENRTRQMRVLKETCIPQMAFLLHSVLHSTDQYSKVCIFCASIVKEVFESSKEVVPFPE